MAFAPGASYGPAKKWDPSRYAKVADASSATIRPRLHHRRLAQRTGGRRRICYLKMRGKGLGSHRRYHLGPAGGPACPLSLLITNDSGAMHVAAATQTPIVALFGPTDPAKTSPYGVRYRILRAGGRIAVLACCANAPTIIDV